MAWKFPQLLFRARGVCVCHMRSKVGNQPRREAGLSNHYSRERCYMVGVANPSPASHDDQTFLALPIVRVVPYAFDLFLQVNQCPY